MRWLVIVLLAASSVARTRCDRKKLIGVDKLAGKQLLERLLEACPEPPDYLAAWIHPGDAVRAEKFLRDARDAYVHGDYDLAVRIASITFSAAPAVEAWLVSSGIPANRAHQLAVTVDPRPPKQFKLPNIQSYPRPAPDGGAGEGSVQSVD